MRILARILKPAGGRADTACMSRRSLGAIIVVAGMIVATLMVSLLVQRAQERGAADERQQLGDRAEVRVDDIISATVFGLEGVAALFHASETVERDEFAAFATTTLDRPGLNTVGFVEYVTESERTAWERRNGVRITAISENGPRPAPVKSRYFPIAYGQRNTGEAVVAGADLSSAPERDEALRAALTTGEARATAPLELLTDDPGVIIFQPIFETPEDPPPSLRTERLVGFASGVFRTELLGPILAQGLPTATAIQVFDGDTKLVSVGAEISLDEAVIREVDVAGRTWTVAVGPAATASGYPALITAVLGGLITLAAITLFMTWGLRERYAAQQVERRMRERDTAEVELRASEERYRTEAARFAGVLSAATELSIIGCDPDGAITVFNTGAERMLGYRAAEILGRTPIGLHLPPEIEERARELKIGPGFDVLAHEARNGGADTREWTYVRKDGTTLPAVVTVTAMHDVDGWLSGYIMIGRDLTSQRDAEKARQDSDLRYRSLVAAMGDGLIVRDRKGRVAAANAAAERILGVSAEDLNATALDPESMAAIDENEEPISRDELPSVKVLRTGQAEHDRVVGMRSADGRHLWLSVSAEPLVADGAAEAAGVVVCFTDITERMAAAEVLRQERDHWATLIGSMQDGLVERDVEGTITAVNPRFCEMTGYDAEDLVGSSLPYPFWPEELSEPLKERVAAVHMGESIEFDTQFRRADGTPLPVIVAATPLRGTTGEVTGSISTVKDVTERERIDRMKDEFVSMVSHELRTPLTSIHGAIGMITDLEDAVPTTAQRLLDIAHRNTDRLTRLINDVLDLEKMATRTRAELRGEESSRALLERAVDLMRPAAEEKGVLLNIAPEAREVALVCDPDGVGQVLTNYLSNAIKFSETGTTITASCTEADGDLDFTVADRGPGIAVEDLERIFERFHQVDSSHARSHGGTGLGLAIARRIAELHDGRAWAESIVGEGSTFHLAIPRDLTADPVDAEGADTEVVGAPS